MHKFYIAVMWDAESEKYLSAKASCKEILQHEVNGILKSVPGVIGSVNFYKGDTADDTTYPALEEGEKYILYYTAENPKYRGTPCKTTEATEEHLKKALTRIQEDKISGLTVIAGKSLKPSVDVYSQVTIKELNDEEIAVVE